MSDRLYSELSETMEGTHEQNEYRKNAKTYFKLSVKGTKKNRMSDEKMGANMRL
jgi:hypothetical protein